MLPGFQQRELALNGSSSSSSTSSSSLSLSPGVEAAPLSDDLPTDDHVLGLLLAHHDNIRRRLGEPLVLSVALISIPMSMSIARHRRHDKMEGRGQNKREGSEKREADVQQRLAVRGRGWTQQRARLDRPQKANRMRRRKWTAVGDGE